MSNNLEVTLASGDHFDVREFSVHQSMSSLFTVTVTALCSNPDVDFEAVIGQQASFTLYGRSVDGTPRTWTGICNELHQLRVEEKGLTAYHINIVPKMWLMSQRRNHRIFQGKSELDITQQLLSEWGVETEQKIEGTYKSRKYRVQYGETDFAFLSRMLEEAGISFYFAEKDKKTVCVLSDAPHRNEERAKPIAFRDEPSLADSEHITTVRVSRHVRPGKMTLRDHDYRRSADFPLGASAASGGVEEKLESFHYVPGAFVFETQKGEPTPFADDKGMHRADEAEGAKLAEKRLHASRSDASVASFHTNVIDLRPGTVMSVLDHPHRDLGDGKRLLVLESRIDGRVNEDISHHCEVRTADQPYAPPLRQTKPKAAGVESATVVGPAGEEIHTDEFGRVRVQFHWDREGNRDDNSSCWIHVSQPWGGASFGGTNLPRIGQEVIVDFLGGDPDRPVITGRVYTNLQKTPYKLPENKTQSGWKSNSSPSNGGYNEMMFEDKAGSELLRMRAEKDMTTRVNNDKALSVGRDRMMEIQRDDEEKVTGNQRQAVGGNQLSRVVENLLSVVGGDRVMKTIGNLVSQAATHAINGQSSITLNVGGSQISIDGDKIVIKANLVLINP
ncbi:MAG TPA: type VI secretion system tip protein TssI/VgrG [Polyangium sp.]|nr:type VI secretion system tip protein TssI/VgrG [Polyangium sp.]